VAVGVIVAVILVAAVLQGVDAAQEIGTRQQQTQAVQSYQVAATATADGIAAKRASVRATAEAGVTRQAIRDATAAAVPTVAWYDVHSRAWVPLAQGGAS